MVKSFGEWVAYPLDDRRKCWLFRYSEWGAGVFVIEEGQSPDNDPDKSLCSWEIRSGGSFAGAQLARGQQGEIGVDSTKRMALEALAKLRANWTKEA